MTRVIIVIYVLLFAAGHLAAASKTFGGSGGYGAEEGVAQAQQQPVENESYGGTGGDAAEEGAAQAQQPVENDDGSYGISLTPTTATEEPATPAAETQQPYTPETQTSGEASSASPATQQGQEGYGSSSGTVEQSSNEPLNGLNEKAINDILQEHNVFRAKEHVPPLKWNTTLAKFSQDYVETLKKDCKMVHSTSPYGENLMLGSGAISWKMTVDEWSAEKKSYNYGANTCEPGKMCGHYTAVVWKDTTSVGCGRVLCDNKETLIMCSYWPPGNYVDQRPY